MKTYKNGDMFWADGTGYMLVQSEPLRYCLVPITGPHKGNRWIDAMLCDSIQGKVTALEAVALAGTLDIIDSDGKHVSEYLNNI